MTYAENLWLYAALVFGIVIVPGVDMLFVLANALTGGRRAGLAATAGIMLGGAAHTLFGAVGVGLVLEQAPSLFDVMLLAGAAYTAWIGVTLLRTSIAAGAVGGAAGRRPLRVVFRQGLVTCLLNPKAYLFVIAVFPQFMKPQYGLLWGQAVVIGVITVLTQLSVYGALTLAAGRGRDFLASRPRTTMLVGRAAGVLLILVAVLTIWHR